jgi:phage shock protein A
MSMSAHESEDRDARLEIDAALSQARRRDLELRNAVARAIARRTEIQMLLERAEGDAAGAREDAIAALQHQDAATDAGEAQRWQRAAEDAALRLTPAEALVESLRSQYATAAGGVEQARGQVEEHERQLEGLMARRAELGSRLAAAGVQDELSQMLGRGAPADPGPTLAELDERIRDRLDLAAARAEVDAGVSVDDQKVLEQGAAATEARARLDQLRRERGIEPR